jgi:hypothetical protein
MKVFGFSTEYAFSVLRMANRPSVLFGKEIEKTLSFLLDQPIKNQITG